MANKIINGDCLEVIKTLKDNSIDAIVTDPPYGLSFMGKKWDYDVPKVEIWQECLRVLKPGGYLLSFAGTRTQHRMAVRIEDAGFEIRDMIAWVYGSGFPKSLNIGKAVDKIQGNEREIVGEHPNPAGNKAGGNSLNMSAVGMPETAILTKGTSEWEGWGTALKPALEPITVARKPIEGTVAQNCLKWGVGGINIDGCRVGTEERTYGGMSANQPEVGTFRDDNWKPKDIEVTVTGRFPANLIHDGSDEVVGLFPNSKSTIARCVTRQPRNSSGVWDNQNNGLQNGSTEIEGYSDSGSAARFFYCAKASKSERNRGCEGVETSKKFTAGNYSQSPTCKDCNLTLNGTNNHSKCSGEVYYKEMESKNTKNNHPTVKPIALMEYLVKLVSKEGHTVLDPFMGSGSTGIACKKLGIELEPDYVEIAKARIESYKVEPEQEILWQIK